MKEINNYFLKENPNFFKNVKPSDMFNVVLKDGTTIKGCNDLRAEEVIVFGKSFDFIGFTVPEKAKDGTVSLAIHIFIANDIKEITKFENKIEND